MAAVCVANPGGADGHTHDVRYIDLLSGHGSTGPGGQDGHSHEIVNWVAQPGSTGHTHHVTCQYDPSVQGAGGGFGSGI